MTTESQPSSSSIHYSNVSNGNYGSTSKNSSSSTLFSSPSQKWMILLSLIVALSLFASMDTTRDMKKTYQAIRLDTEDHMNQRETENEVTKSTLHTSSSSHNQPKFTSTELKDEAVVARVETPPMEEAESLPLPKDETDVAQIETAPVEEATSLPPPPKNETVVAQIETPPVEEAAPLPPLPKNETAASLAKAPPVEEAAPLPPKPKNETVVAQIETSPLGETSSTNLPSPTILSLDDSTFKLNELISDRPQQYELDSKYKSMNIVLFYADDWTMKTLGILNKNVQTPHLDEIARNGMLFSSNSVTTSICWQSRATLMTGLYVAVHQHLRIYGETMFNKTVVWPLTLFPLLRTHGHHVGFFGKWHAPMPPQFEKQTFDVWDNYWGEHWMKRDGQRKHVTQCNGEDAMRYLREQRPRDQKFALTISFYATHASDGDHYPNQYNHQNYTAHLYVNDTMPTPKTATDQHWMDMPWFFTEENEGRGRWRRRYDTPEHFQVSMKKYYRMATEVDDVIGMVVQELKDQGVYNNTYILFTTDNGNFHAEHGLADKWYPHEESIKVPLLIQDPRMPPEVRGTTNDEFTLNIDLAPTLLTAAGIPVPKYMQGRDIAELYLRADKTKPLSPPWRKDFFYEWTQGRPSDGEGHGSYWHIPTVFALIRKDYKYFYWPQTNYEQLFHLRVDPFEENDIYNITLQQNPALLSRIKARYAFLKNVSQRGLRV